MDYEKKYGDSQKFNFPECVKTSLAKIEKHLLRDQDIPGIGGSDEQVSSQLADQYIFFTPQSWAPRRRGLTPMQDLQLQETLNDFFEHKIKDSVRLRVFSVIFDMQNQQHYKLELLWKLTSMAIAVKSTKLLDVTAKWIMTMGCQSFPCQDLAKRLVKDYCNLVPGAINTFRELPNVSKPFACSFLTVLTYLYNTQGEIRTGLPQAILLETIIDWIMTDSSLLFTFCASNSDSVPITPIPGFLKWCVMSPLLHQRLNSCNQEIDQSEVAKKSHLSYSKLHYGIVNSLLSSHVKCQLFTVVEIASLVDCMVAVLMTIPNVMASDQVHCGLERLGQLLQVTLMTGTLLANKANLKKVCERLPRNRLMEIVLKDGV